MEALRLDISIDENGSAREVLGELFQKFVVAGDSSEVAAKKVEKFEKSLKDATAKKEAKDALDGLAKSTKNVGDESDKAAPRVDALTSIIKRYAGPTAVLGAIKATMTWTDNLTDLAKQTGINTTALQRWDGVAKANGDTLNQLTTAAQRLGADLVQGDKSVVAGITKLGFSVDQLLKMDPAQRFEEVAKAIAEIKDPAMQAALAEDVLKRSGIELLDTMKDLGNGAKTWAPPLGEEYVAAGAMMQNAFEQSLDAAKKLGMYMVTVFPKTMMDGVKAWKEALQTMGLMEENAAPALPGNPLSAPSLPKFDPLGGNSMSFIENELTNSTKQLISARSRAAGATSASADAEHALIAQSASNNWMLGARGLASNVSGGTPWGVKPFPGWAPPDLLQPTGWQPPMAGYPGAPGMNAPGAMGGGGSFWDKLLGGLMGGAGGQSGGGNFWQKFQGFMGSGSMGAGMATGGIQMLANLIPSKSAKGKNIGSTVGAIAGSIIPGVGTWLGSLAGGVIGGLFGGGEKGKVDKSRQGLMDQFGGFDNLAKLASDAGFNLDKMFSTRKVKDFEAEVGKLNKALQDQEKDALRLDNAIEKYGFSLNDMGAKFKQTTINKGFKELAEDFRVLIGAGADFNTVVEKMAPHFNELVNVAMETGSQVPRELEPIIRKMMEMGMLTDRSGNKLEDLAAIPFAETMTEGFDRVVAALDKIAAALGGVVGQFDKAAGAAQDFSDIIQNTGDIGMGGGGSDPILAARGGLILGKGRVQYFGGGGFVPQGTDTVPAMLSPGELVIPRNMVRELMGEKGKSESTVIMVAVPVQSSDEETINKTFEMMPRRVMDGQIRVALQNLIESTRKRRAA
jgi:hypothetical protein